MGATDSRQNTIDVIVASPTHGVVRQIKVTPLNETIVTIYIAPNDNHEIRAPSNGMITDVQFHQGIFVRPFFQATETHTGQLVVTIRETSTHIKYEFLVEVGIPPYITDTIRLEAVLTTGRTIERDQLLGEIVIGSLAELYIPSVSKLLVREGSVVKAGKTAIATLR